MDNNKIKANDRLKYSKFSKAMNKKLAVLFVMVLLAFVGLSIRILLIDRDSGDRYKRQVLSQQQYDSRVIPYKRGDIVDSKGTKLAVSDKVYNIILDAKAFTRKQEGIEPTLKALKTCFNLDTDEIDRYIRANPTSQYHVLARKLSYDKISRFVSLQADKEHNPDIMGIWFEEEYKRTYPNGSLACDVIGFTGKDNVGNYGLEEYYNSVLNGSNGREYGYLNDDSSLERTTKPAVDGNTIVTTLDANIQSIVEKYLRQFNDEYKNNFRDGNGAFNIGCIAMNPNNGDILAMASYPDYDLNDVKNPDRLIGSVKLDKDGRPTEEVISKVTLATMDEETLYANLNALWKNYCITSTYEPGSVMKPFTVATGLESGRLSGEESYFCNGSAWYGGHEIHCHNRLGDGQLTVKQAVEKSCNVALMSMAETIGRQTFLKFQKLFNFGLKTNIDLAGEARTVSLVYNDASMGEAELATASFGQGSNVTMIQTITAFSALINGGFYYEPHVVKKIVSSDGTTIKNVEPRVLKQVISQSTSDKIVDYCNGVVTEGTGKTARPAGYTVGGKTGTAEMVPRNKRNYVVSFMGYAPVDNPEIIVYVVVDRPNHIVQDDAKFATRITNSILTETLPYLNCFMTEELSDDELDKLDSISGEIGIVSPVEAQEGENAGMEGDAEDRETVQVITPEELTKEQEAVRALQEELSTRNSQYQKDEETGYLVEPGTGALIDPATGAVMDGSSFMD